MKYHWKISHQEAIRQSCHYLRPIMKMRADITTKCPFDLVIKDGRIVQSIIMSEQAKGVIAKLDELARMISEEIFSRVDSTTT